MADRDVLRSDARREGTPQGKVGELPDLSCLLYGGMTHIWHYYDNEAPPFYETPCGILLALPDFGEGTVTCLICLAAR